MTSEWLKGGLRYAKLKEAVREHLTPETVETFFVGRRKREGFGGLFNPFSPLRREYVIAVTDEKVFVLKLKLPGVFRAAVASVSHETLRRDAKAAWQKDRLVLDGGEYWPIAFHDEDAEEVASLLRST